MGYNEILLFWDRYGIKRVCPLYIYILHTFGYINLFLYVCS